MWHTEYKQLEFSNKAFAFEYLNNIAPDVDDIYLFCDGELRYSKSHLGIYNHLERCYIKGLLPTENYN